MIICAKSLIATSSPQPILITSFALYIGADRGILTDYANIAEYSPIIKKLEAAAEDYAVRYFYSGKNPAGVIFYLKNRHGWVDKQEISHSVTVQYAPQSTQQIRAAVDNIDLLEAAQAQLPETVIEAQYEEVDSTTVVGIK